jgi:hypothetical protein
MNNFFYSTPDPYFQFDVDKQTDSLRTALTSKQSTSNLIRLLTQLTSSQRQQIKTHYISAYGESLEKLISNKLSGDFRDCVIALFDSPTTFDAKQIFKAIDGAGTDEDTLTEIIATRAPHKFTQLKAEYQSSYNETLKQAIEGDTSGDYLQLLLALIEGGRNDNAYPNEAACNSMCELLHSKADTKEKECFMKVLVMYSPSEVAMIARMYMKKYKQSLKEVVEKVYKGDAKLLVGTLVESLVNPSRYFATRIRKAVDSFSVKSKILIRVIVTRNEIDIPQIKRWYKRMYKSDMIEDIKKKLKGDFMELIVALCNKQQ